MNYLAILLLLHISFISFKVGTGAAWVRPYFWAKAAFVVDTIIFFVFVSSNATVGVVIIVFICSLSSLFCVVFFLFLPGLFFVVLLNDFFVLSHTTSSCSSLTAAITTSRGPSGGGGSICSNSGSCNSASKRPLGAFYVHDDPWELSCAGAALAATTATAARDATVATCPRTALDDGDSWGQQRCAGSDRACYASRVGVHDGGGGGAQRRERGGAYVRCRCDGLPEQLVAFVTVACPLAAHPRASRRACALF